MQKGRRGRGTFAATNSSTESSPEHRPVALLVAAPAQTVAVALHIRTAPEAVLAVEPVPVVERIELSVAAAPHTAPAPEPATTLAVGLHTRIALVLAVAAAPAVR